MNMTTTPPKKPLKRFTPADLRRIEAEFSADEGQYEDQDYWPKGKDIESISKRLKTVLSTGKSLQQSGQVVRSGNIAFLLKEILQQVHDIEVIAQRGESIPALLD